MDNLNLEIKDTFEAISLLLVFATVLFDLKYRDIQNDLEEEIPEGEKSKDRHRQSLWRSFRLNSLPLNIIFGMTFFIFLPLMTKIISNSEFRLWDFDFLRTSFVFIVILVGGMFIWSIWLSVKLIGRIQKSK